MNKMMLTSAALMIFAGVFASGCGGSDCESICEDAKDCNGTSSTKGVDCSERCDQIEKANDDVGCSEKYDKFVSCASGLDDVCSELTAGDPCSSELTAYTNCLAQ